MKTYTIQHLAEIISAEIIGQTSGQIQEIYFDSRTIYKPNEGIFFDFSAFINDSQKYIHEAYEKGIRIFVISKDVNFENDATYLKVNSTIEALQKWSIHHRNRFQLPVVGITGSNGKTIVKEWLNQLLWKKFSIVRSPKSYNSQIGAPISVLQITEKNDLALFEAGISKQGEMNRPINSSSYP